MDQPKLIQILTKIAYRMPWDEWDISEDEYDVLE